MFRGELHVNVGSLKIRTSPLTTWFGQNARKESSEAKADLLFLFANQVKWGSTWKNVIFGIIKRKMSFKCYSNEKITEKYKKSKQALRHLRKLNKKGNSFPGRFSTNIIPDVDFTRYGSVSKIKTKDVCKTITDVAVQAFIKHFHNKWYFNEILFFYCITICKYCQYSATLGKVEIFIFPQNNWK